MQIIFIHGLGQTPSSWDKTVSCLSEQITAQCPDLSSLLNDAESTYENLYRVFAAYCDEFPEPIDLCGLSLGAVLALNYAIDNPQKVGTLILIAPQYKMPKALLKCQNFIFKFMPKSTFENIGANKQDFINLTNSMADLDFSGDLKKVVCPALILCGEKDRANMKAAKSLAEIIQNAEFRLVEKSGHEVNVDEPKGLAEIINAYYLKRGFIMKTNVKSIYETIKENIVNGELPRYFSLPSNQSENKVNFADGARDGIGVYHMGRADISEESMSKLNELMHNVSDGNFELGAANLADFAKDNTALNAIDAFEGFIYDNTDWIDPNNLHRFAEECLMSDDRNIVKYGMEMIEVFSEPNESIKEIIRTLGLSDEFTIFSIFNMQHWSNANDEIFSIAQKVHGWGRVHAVKYLEPANEEIKEWLLKEGVKNDIMPDYSALEVYNKADVRTLLKEKLTDDVFSYVVLIIDSLLYEGPVCGISAIEDADSMLLDFLDHVKQHGLNLDICETVYRIISDNRSDEVNSLCGQILNSDETKEIVICSLNEGKGINLAEYLNIDYAEPLYRHMSADFDNGCNNCRHLIRNYDYRDKVLDLFRKNLPMDEMVSEPTDCVELGAKYQNYTRLMFLIQELKPYPLCGVDFVELGLKSPVVNNRNMSLRVLDSWCKIKECSLHELSEELFNCVAELKEKEVSDSVKKSIEEYGF